MEIPYKYSMPDLRDAADRFARKEGYRVKALPTISFDRKLVTCTYIADDGVAFQRCLTAEQVLRQDEENLSS